MLLSNGSRLLLRPRAPWSSAALQQQGSSRRRAFLATAASTPGTGDARGAPPSAYAAVTEEDMKAFERILSTEGGGGGKLLRPSPSEPSSLEAYTSDWTRKWSAPGCPAVLQPRSTEQVSALLRHCNARRIAVVPQGGNTGLVGGSIPVRDEVVLSLAGMKGVLGFDAVSGILTCEAGCVLEELDTWLRERGFIMPLDLGAKGSCQIGGNVSTNAGGLRYLRYGSLHGTVLGLEVVLADGTVLDMLSTLRKDNTGLDLKHLFIGAEGTLGVVTKVAIHVPPAPKAVNVALVGLESFARVQEMVVLAKRSLGEVLSAMELIDAHSLALVLRKRAWGLRNPLGGSYPFYMLLETSGSDEAHDVAKLENLLEEAVEGAVVADGAIAQDLAQARDMWKLRELIPVAIEEEGRVHKYDVSVPLPVFYDIVAETRQRLASRPSVQVVGYGHLGDSNLHLNIAIPRGEPDPTEAIDAVLPWVMAHKGSVSAEHGLGQLKAKYLPMTKSPAVYQLMVAQKRLLDPHSILNPFKYYGGMAQQQEGKA